MTTRAYHVALILAIVVSPAALPASSALADALAAIQPGNSIETPVGYCTLNFAFRDATGRFFMGTAGHCVEGTGDRIRTDGASWGTVVSDLDETTGTDFALIRVDADKQGLVVPAVRHWGGPTGVSDYTTTNRGDVVAFYGYGMGFEVHETVRARQGLLWSDSPNEYSTDMPAVWGDSGGPVLHKETGEALGVISQFNLPFSTDIGPSVARILQDLRAGGFAGIDLVTAPATGALV